MATLHLPDETLAMLADVAKATGRDTEELAAEALAAFVADKTAFSKAVNEGKDAVRAGQVISDEELEESMEAFMAQHERH